MFGRLRSCDWLRSLSRRDFVRGLAELYGDLNALHPFREGNGRTQRAFPGCGTGGLPDPRPRRAPFTPEQFAAAHLDSAYTGAGPYGHGFTQAAASRGKLYS